MTTSHKSVPNLFLESPINPRTGRIWSLADAEVAPELEKLTKKLTTPEKAREFLNQVGLVDKTGKLKKAYGG
jgi:hypothetical protein